MSQREEWPAWATEPIHVVDADPAWQVRGEQERQTLEDCLAPWVRDRIEHVGSTAVPGLPAKPIIDLQAAVADLEVADAVAATLAPYGWYFVGPGLDRRPWRRLFVKVVDGHRAAHLHLMTAGSSRLSEQRAFRDALATDLALRKAYAALKRDLAAQHTDRAAYTDAKGDFVRMVLSRSG